MKKSLIIFFAAFTTFVSLTKFSQAETINCDLKTITIENGDVTKIKHEDGTIHSGKSASENWTYDGKILKHTLIDERILCGTKPKSRNEIILDLSSRFIKNPTLHGLDSQEAKWMTSYTENLMKTENNCHLLVDASKSTKKNNSFYIDCNDKSGSSHRYWLSRSELKSGSLISSSEPISKSSSINICNKELRSKVAHPNTYKPALLTGTASRSIESKGRNIVEINFTAKNVKGEIGKFQGKCILESGRLIETTVTSR